MPGTAQAMADVRGCRGGTYWRRTRGPDRRARTGHAKARVPHYRPPLGGDLADRSCRPRLDGHEPNMSARAVNALRRLGVTPVLNAAVVEVSDRAISMAVESSDVREVQTRTITGSWRLRFTTRRGARGGVQRRARSVGTDHRAAGSDPARVSRGLRHRGHGPCLLRNRGRGRGRDGRPWTACHCYRSDGAARPPRPGTRRSDPAPLGRSGLTRGTEFRDAGAGGPPR